LSELADYRKIHGHCNVPVRDSENIQLGTWVSNQRTQYKLHEEGKKSHMTIFRIQALESLGFEWDIHGTWEYRLNQLADYRKLHGHCNVPRSFSENAMLGNWVAKQRTQYKPHEEGKKSHMTLFRLQKMESLGFEWNSRSAAGEDRLSELADYRKNHGHCNVPSCYSEYTKLGYWVAYQRTQYKLHLKGKTSIMTTYRIQELESLGFEWNSYDAAWKKRLSELAAYRKIHGHCNVPQHYCENIQLGSWVSKQRRNYKLHQEGKKSPMTPLRIQALESLSFA
jgi:hypothetical protein